MGQSKCDVLKLFCYSCDAGNILQCSSDQSTDLFLELSINYIKYHLDQLLLTRFIRELHVQQYQSALYAWSDAHNLTHTLDHSHKDTITSASRLLYPVLFSFSSSVPSGFLPSLSYPLWLPSNHTAVRRGMRGYSTAMEGNAFTGWPGDLPNPWRNPTICYHSASRSVRILIKHF